MSQKKYLPHEAASEARRCLMCEEAPCQSGCPAGVNAKQFIRSIRFDQIERAVRVIRQGNVLGGSCAYICPSCKLCAHGCTGNDLSVPIDISGLQRYVMDRDMAEDLVPLDVTESNGLRVAVVGAGPAGLSCAAYLASLGYHVDVFEKETHAGGQLSLSIPEFRLPRKVIEHEVAIVKKLGVFFHFETEITNPKTLREKGYKAIFVAPGLMKGRSLKVPGEDKKGVYDALDFLMRTKRGEKIELGKRVLVIGGGDTAIDAARVAARHGAQVLMLYRRTQKDMPAYRPDIDEAFDEGVEFWFRVVPMEIVGDERADGVRLARVHWKGEGRQAKEFVTEGSEFIIQGDVVINALGQLPQSDYGLPKDDHGNIACDPTTMMVEEGLFVGGDFAMGAATAVAAVGHGKVAATAIHNYLSGEKITQAPAIHVKQESPDLSVDFCGVHFENPFILAAAPPSDDLAMVREAFKAGWAGAVLKTTSVESEKVDLTYPMMSTLEIDGQKIAGMGNIDLISEHHVDVIEERVKTLKAEFPEKRVIASIMGSKKEEWQSLVIRLKTAGVDMVECSFSCPQGTLGSKPGAMLSQDRELSKTVAGWVKEAAGDLPVVIKISPQVEDIVDTAMAVKEAGVDAVCASNTIPSLMGINLDSFVPYPNVGGKSTYSGMSGPAIKPITLKCIAEIARRAHIPITGTGGPVTWRDAVEFMLVGAQTVQFCTAVMHYGFDIITDLTEGVSDYLVSKDMKSVSELFGRSLNYITTHDQLPRLHKLRSRINSDTCVRCGDCVIACRDGGHMAINWNSAERLPSIDDDKCVGCNLCAIVCPIDDCIQLKDTVKNRMMT